ncbi:MAG TPA: hypothetical protein VMR46_02485 [Candidatus Paceibacterota bacterium]|nr:hypothetical protein [Candidatus Paceibacterota bacterium]
MADSVSSDDIQKLIAALPPEVKSLLYSKEMDDVMQQIGTKHQLHIDQIGELESEVAAAMIGISQMQELPQNISDTLEVDMTKSNALVADINLLLLDKIRSSMKKNDADKSVIMPSAMAASASATAPTPPATSAPVPTAPVAPTPTAAPLPTDMQIDPPATQPTPAPAKVVAPAPQMPEADVMLSEPTVSLPKKVESAPTPTKIEVPTTYKADPYREPIE